MMRSRQSAASVAALFPAQPTHKFAVSELVGYKLDRLRGLADLGWHEVVRRDGVGQPFWEHISPIPTVNPEQCPPYWAHSASPQVQSEHWPALGTGRHAHWVVPSAGLRTFTIC